MLALPWRYAGVTMEIMSHVLASDIPACCCIWSLRRRFGMMRSSSVMMSCFSWSRSSVVRPSCCSCCSSLFMYRVTSLFCNSCNHDVTMVTKWYEWNETMASKREPRQQTVYKVLTAWHPEGSSYVFMRLCVNFESIRWSRYRFDFGYPTK